MNENKLLCPCGRKIEIKSYNGIVWYVHQDDMSSCSILNSFCLKDSGEVYAVKKLIQSVEEKNIEQFYCYWTRNKPVFAINFLCEYFKNKRTKEETIDFFEFLLKIRVFNGIFETLNICGCVCFGDVWLANLCEISGERQLLISKPYSKLKTNVENIIKNGSIQMPDMYYFAKDKIKGIDFSKELEDVIKSFLE